MSLSIVDVSANAATPTTATASPVTAHVVQPDFTCPSPAVCVFQGPGLTNFVVVFSTSLHSQWINMTNPFNTGPSGLALPWGGFNDNSGSSVAFGDAQTGKTTCFGGGTRDPNPPPAVQADRWMWIEFGVPDCSVKLPAVP